MRYLASIVSVLALAGGAPAYAAEPPSHAGYAAWKAAHPRLQADIAKLKARSMAVVAAQAPLDKSEAGLDRPAAIWRVPGAIREVWDSPDAPEMVVIPAGEYTMGWSASAPVLFSGAPPTKPGQVTRHRVRIGYALGFSKYPVTVGQFAMFVAESGYDAGTQCQTTEAGVENNRNWRNPGYPTTDDQPAVCVNFDDAQAYVAWLSKKTGHTYRLPSDAEYEYANRAGTTTTYWWGDEVGKANAACGGACGSVWDNKTPSPVGSFKPNPFGLYDTTGNVWSRTQDCWNETFDGAPSDGSANLSGDCTQRVFRGGGYRSNPLNLRSALRHGNGGAKRFNDDGFHVVRDL